MEESNPTVLIKQQLDGQVKPHALSNLIKNKAYIYLLQNPGKIGTVCKKTRACPGKYFCTFIHFEDDSDDDDNEEEKFFKVVLNKNNNASTSSKSTDDTNEFTLISSKRVVRNQAFKFLWKNPQKQALECRGHPVGITDETCTYVHLLVQQQKVLPAVVPPVFEASTAPATTTTKTKKGMRGGKNKNSCDSETVENQEEEKKNSNDNNSNDDDVDVSDQQRRDKDLPPCPPPCSACNVCFDELENDDDDDDHDETQKSNEKFLMCPKGHRTCKSCLEQYFREVYPKKGIEPGTIPQLTCFTKNCTAAAPFKAGEVARVVDPDAFDIFLSVWKRAVEAKALSEVTQRLHEIVQMSPAQALAAAKALEHATIAKSLADTSHAFMCAECKYGPILLSGCSDLRTHHNEVKGDRSRAVASSNACPRCGNLPRSSNEMMNWDGIVRL